MAEIIGTQKGSLVHRFITSGKPGKCNLCPAIVDKLEAHHLCYSPEITLNLCHMCHHKVHFWPIRLNNYEKRILLSKRFGEIKGLEILEKVNPPHQVLAKLIAPSRKQFIHIEQKLEAQKLKLESAFAKKIHPSRVVRKLNKEVPTSVNVHFSSNKPKK